MEHFCAQDVVGRWYLGGDALLKCRAAEKQKGWSGDIGCYKQATPTGFQAVGGLATVARAMEIWISFCEKTPPKLRVMPRAEALGYCRIYLRENDWHGCCKLSEPKSQ